MKSAAVIRKQIAKLQAQIAATEKNRTKAVKRIVADMQKNGLTLADLKDAMAARPRKAARKRVLGKAPIKYRDAQGNTWSGRGREPLWMTAAIAKGKKRSDFSV